MGVFESDSEVLINGDIPNIRIDKLGLTEIDSWYNAVLGLVMAE